MAGNDAKQYEFTIMGKSLYDALTVALEGALDKLPTDCDCPSEQCYIEPDTNAYIHDEEHCVTTLRDHIEVTLEQLKALQMWTTETVFTVCED